MGLLSDLWAHPAQSTCGACIWTITAWEHGKQNGMPIRPVPRLRRRNHRMIGFFLPAEQFDRGMFARQVARIPRIACTGRDTHAMPAELYVRCSLARPPQPLHSVNDAARATLRAKFCVTAPVNILAVLLPCGVPF